MSLSLALGKAHHPRTSPSRSPSSRVSSKWLSQHLVHAVAVRDERKAEGRRKQEGRQKARASAPNSVGVVLERFEGVAQVAVGLGHALLVIEPLGNLQIFLVVFQGLVPRRHAARQNLPPGRGVCVPSSFPLVSPAHLLEFAQVEARVAELVVDGAARMARGARGWARRCQGAHPFTLSCAWPTSRPLDRLCPGASRLQRTRWRPGNRRP